MVGETRGRGERELLGAEILINKIEFSFSYAKFSFVLFFFYSHPSPSPTSAPSLFEEIPIHWACALMFLREKITEMRINEWEGIYINDCLRKLTV